MKYIILMFILAGIIVTLQLTVILSKEPPPTVETSTPVATTTAPVAPVVPQSAAPAQKTAPAAQNAPVTAPPPITINMYEAPQPPAPAPSNPAPQPTPASVPAPAPTPVATTTTAPTLPPSVHQPTEEEAKPVITLDGVRDGDNVTFTWSARGYKEGLECKIGGQKVEQDGSTTVQSVEPYTLTIVCMGIYTASRTEKSLTK